ncbi:MAG: peroxiredoxin [Gammaproteobacteria bacterium]|nr:peroxiredoxin [Gammaproteobacteria bacterium]
MLKPDSSAPEFILPDENGNDVSLSDLLQNGPLILYFYPADFTPGCTKEACSIRDVHGDIEAVGLQVVGVSPQDGESHERFRKEHKLPFKLLSDTDKVAIKMYDVDGPFGVGVRRVTYLISQGKKIQAALQADVLVNRHTEFIQKAIMLREAAGIRVDDRDRER